ncbi:MAG: AsmA family protein [Janthinobacterium lividum]
MQLQPSSTIADTEVRPPTHTRIVASRPPSRLRRRLLWGGGIAVTILLLVFLPPLVNANHYQRQIARSMSESLGRPVHLDNVVFHLLPVPGLTLSNLVVSEDPAFGAEPTIRANTVEASLRLGSLWRRRVEFSSVRFIEPSINLVRNREGRWNLANVLLHASHVETAPTVQRRAGPAPRFPYIEATGGRVNLKLDEEKLPFSLTDAEFALWLPSPNHWRVRLRGEPARTDTNLNDPGVFRLEGALERAGVAGDVPIDLHASWHNAPLGEASRLLAAEDKGWRGTLNVDASLAGTLSAARFASQITLGDLRRAEFAAATPLDLQITCGAGLSVETVSFQKLLCTMPDSAPEPMRLDAETLDLQRPAQAQATLKAEQVPLHWGLLWAALFSARIPTELNPAATADLHFEHLVAGSNPGLASKARSRHATAAKPAGQPVSAWSAWDGEVIVHLPQEPALRSASTADNETGTPLNLHWHTDPGSAPATKHGTGNAEDNSGLSFRLQPITIPFNAGAAVTVSATLTPTGYTVAVNGTASAPALLLPARYLPQLGDGLEDILPFPPTGAQPSRVDFTCDHPWGALQTCVSLRPVPTSTRSATPAIIPAQSRIPELLRPHSLSPFDHHSELGSPTTPQ